MPPDYSGTYAKLRRAEEHTKVLKQDVNAWFHNPHYKIVTEANADFTRHSIFLQRIDTCEPPVERWSMTFGDAIHNFRSALDHLIFAIALDQNRGGVRNERKVAFPLIKDPKDFSSAKANVEKGCTLSSNVWSAIERVQPYNRPTPKLLLPFLYLLAEFDNSDKHRLPHAFIGAATEVDARLEGIQPPGAFPVEAAGFAGALQDRTEIAWMTFNIPTPDMKYKINHVDVAFVVPHEKRDPAALNWTGRTEAGAMLREINSEVRFVIDEMKSAIVLD